MSLKACRNKSYIVTLNVIYVISHADLKTGDEGGKLYLKLHHVTHIHVYLYMHHTFMVLIWWKLFVCFFAVAANIWNKKKILFPSPEPESDFFCVVHRDNKKAVFTFNILPFLCMFIMFSRKMLFYVSSETAIQSPIHRVSLYSTPLQNVARLLWIGYEIGYVAHSQIYMRRGKMFHTVVEIFYSHKNS